MTALSSSDPHEDNDEVLPEGIPLSEFGHLFIFFSFFQLTK